MNSSNKTKEKKKQVLKNIVLMKIISIWGIYKYFMCVVLTKLLPLIIL